MKTLLISDLEKIQKIEDVNPMTQKVIGVFLSAINDWPSSISKLEDYELEVRNFIGNIITKLEIEKTLAKIDYSNNSWQAESLTQLLDVFQFYDKGLPLNMIIVNLLENLEKEKLI